MIEILTKWLAAKKLPEKLMYIGGSDILPPPLERKKESAAIEAMNAGDESAKQVLIEHNLRLVVYISRRFESTGINLEELYFGVVADATGASDQISARSASLWGTHGNLK